MKNEIVSLIIVIISQEKFLSSREVQDRYYDDNGALKLRSSTSRLLPNNPGKNTLPIEKRKRAGARAPMDNRRLL